MKRTFAPEDLVTLPILDANGAQALALELLAIAAASPLAPAQKKAAAELEAAADALADALVKRGPRERAPDTKAAYRALAAAWKGLYDWLRVWARHAGKSAEAAKQIEAVLFGDGLEFIKLRFHAVWVQSGHRLDWVAEHPLSGELSDRGARELVKAVRAAHKRFGEVLYITAVAPRPVAKPSVRAALDAVCRRLRVYVLQVALDPAAPSLLAPLTETRRARRRPRRSKDEIRPVAAAPGSRTTESEPAVENVVTLTGRR
jgi:hypothetical protein